MPDLFQYEVFLSHSAKDKTVVRFVTLSASNGKRDRVRCRSLSLLRQDGLKVWPVPPKRPREGGFDESVLKPGDSIPAKIDPPSPRSYGGTGEGLEHSRVLVLCMSANAFGSDWAQLACPAIAPTRRRKAGTCGRGVDTS
jgi:hypothetical protein